MGRSKSAVIVNADDFGISAKANREIVRCFEAGRISSATIMPTQGHFEEAVNLAKSAGFHDRVGIHINITSGKPLSTLPAEYLSPIGEFAFPDRRVWAAQSVRRALYSEIREQVARVVDYGVRPTHFDSHEHALNSIPYTSVALRVAGEFGVKWMRPARNCFFAGGILKRGFKTVYNGYLSAKGVRWARWFTDFKPYLDHRRRGGAILVGTAELMCHPAARIRPESDPLLYETDLLLSQEFEDCLRGHHLVSYRDM